VITITVYNCKAQGQAQDRPARPLPLASKRTSRGNSVLGELGGVGFVSSITKSCQRKPLGVTWRKVAIPTTDITSRFLNQSSSQSLAAAHFRTNIVHFCFLQGFSETNCTFMQHCPGARFWYISRVSPWWVSAGLPSTWGPRRSD
jgi:hypothetical protein